MLNDQKNKLTPSRLSSLLVSGGLVSVKRMETAFQRQVVYGGTLDTILLEMHELQEAQLIPFLSLAAGLKAAEADETAAAPQAIDLCPQALAEAHKVVPVAVGDGYLRVLVFDPIDIGTIEELADHLQMTIQPRVVPEYRFRLAFAAAFSTEVDGRFASLADQSHGKPSKSKPPKQANEQDLLLEVVPKRGASGKKATKRSKRAKADPQSKSRSRTQTNKSTKRTKQAPTRAKSQSKVQSGKSAKTDKKPVTSAAGDSDLSSVTPAEASGLLDTATSRDEVFTILLRALRGHASYAGLLTVQKEALVGRVGIKGEQLDEGISQVRIPLSVKSPFAQVVDSAAPYIGPIGETGESSTDKESSTSTNKELDEMISRMGGIPSAAALIPIVLRNRVVALCIAHRGKAGIRVNAASQLFPVATAAADALSRIIKQSKSPGKKRAETNG